METKHLVGLLAAVNVVGLCMAGNVMAEDNYMRNNYGLVKVGMFQPSGDMDDANYDNGGDLSIVYGRYLNRYLVLEAGFDVFGSDQKTIYGYNPRVGDYRQDNSLVAVAGLVTLKGEMPVGPVDLFGGIGGGIYSVTLSSDIDSSRYYDISTDDSDGVFGMHVVAGANFNINDRFFVGVEGKYRWTGDVDIHDTVASIPVDYKGDLSGYAVTFNAGLRF